MSTPEAHGRRSFPQATPAQIRAAYHGLSRSFHPDKQPPELRDQATTHFNAILVAYETLNNPRKRIVYDQLGHAGLKSQMWQMGPKTMSAEDFKHWLQQAAKKQQTDDIEALVGSKGSIKVGLDVSGLRYDTITRGKNGIPVLQPIPPVLLTNFAVKKSFQVPLVGLGQALNTPLPAALQPAGTVDVPHKGAEQEIENAPTLTVSASVGGAPFPTKDTAQFKAIPLFAVRPTLIGATSLGLSLEHNFPALPPNAPRSVASVLAGNGITVYTGVFPAPALSAQVGRSFGANQFAVQSTFFQVPFISAPATTTVQLSRVLGLRHRLLAVVRNDNSSGQYPSSLWSMFLPPPTGVRQGMASLGYTYTPLPPGIDDDRKSRRSKNSETYSATISAGLLAGGGMVKFSWERTFFVCTPIGAPSPSPSSPSSSQTSTAAEDDRTGIRLGAEYTRSLTATAFSIGASRAIFTHSHLGLRLSIGGVTGTGGITLALTWTRLGQRLALPVVIAPVRDVRVIAFATAVPTLLYLALEAAYLRPRQRRRHDADRAAYADRARHRVLRARHAALQAQELMRVVAERRADEERQRGGLVVDAAYYGARGRWADVTVPLMAAVEAGQLVVPRAVRKDRMLGWWDPAPGEEKRLEVRYRYGGERHEVKVRGGQGLVLPLKVHRVKR